MDVAIRDAMVPEAGTPAFFRGVRELGVNAVEIEIAPDLTTPQARRADGTAFPLVQPEEVKAFSKALRSEGLRVCALLLATDLTGPDADRHSDWIKAAADLAGTLGAPVLRIDPLSRDKQLTRETSLVRLVLQMFIKQVSEYDVEIDVSIENHGPFANDPAFLDAIFEAFPNLGLTLDTGNFYWFGFPLDELYGLIERYAPRVKHTHVKNINYPPELANVKREIGVGYKEYCCSLDEGNIDLVRVVRILRAAGYDRDMCVENESLFKHPPENRADVLRRDVAAVRAAMAE
jgi:sugar phosphate isomerase/epimerase